MLVLGIRMCTHAEHVESLKRRSSKRGRDDSMLPSAYPVHGSVSEVNRLDAKVQVISYCYYLVFHPFVE